MDKDKYGILADEGLDVKVAKNNKGDLSDRPLLKREAIAVIFKLIFIVSMAMLLVLNFGKITSYIEDLTIRTLGTVAVSTFHIDERAKRYDFDWMTPEDFQTFLYLEDFTPNIVDVEDKGGYVECSTPEGGVYNKYYGNIEYTVRKYDDGRIEGTAYIDADDELRALCALLNADRDSVIYNSIDYGFTIDVTVPVEINGKKYNDHQVLDYEDGKLKILEEYANAD